MVTNINVRAGLDDWKLGHFFICLWPGNDWYCLFLPMSHLVSDIYVKSDPSKHAIPAV